MKRLFAIYPRDEDLSVKEAMLKSYFVLASDKQSAWKQFIFFAKSNREVNIIPVVNLSEYKIIEVHVIGEV